MIKVYVLNTVLLHLSTCTVGNRIKYVWKGKLGRFRMPESNVCWLASFKIFRKKWGCDFLGGPVWLDGGMQYIEDMICESQLFTKAET